MLISFSVSNYRSFGEEQTLNMVASGKIADHPEHLVPIGETGKSVVRTAVIYGANAAGKSNLVKAMEFAQRAIAEQGIPVTAVEPFRFEPTEASRPTSFEFRFLIDNRIFIYGFDITRSEISGEWLALLKEGNDDLVVFERNSRGEAVIDSKASSFLSDDLTVTTLEKLASLPLKQNQLLLNRAVGLPESVQGATLRGIIRWLVEDLIILRPQYKAFDLLDRLANDSTFRTFASAFLGQVGTGVGGLQIQEAEREASDWERKHLQRLVQNGRSSAGFMSRPGEMDVRPKLDDPDRVVSRVLLAEHPTKDRTSALPFSEESDGTRQLLHFMPVLATSPQDTKVIVIDELDRSLHPLICWEFLRFFSETCPGARKQLIVTTHEAHLLNQELLRRDEYWFVEKDDRQQSRLVPLSEFKVRNDLQIEKGYLQGRFGAIPIIGSMSELETLLECRLTTEETDAPQESAS